MAVADEAAAVLVALGAQRGGGGGFGGRWPVAGSGAAAVGSVVPVAGSGAVPVGSAAVMACKVAALADSVEGLVEAFRPAVLLVERNAATRPWAPTVATVSIRVAASFPADRAVESGLDRGLVPEASADRQTELELDQVWARRARADPTAGLGLDRAWAPAALADRQAELELDQARAGGAGGPDSGIGARPGMGAGGVGGPASGVGARPGMGAGGAGGPDSGIGVRPGRAPAALAVPPVGLGLCQEPGREAREPPERMVLVELTARTTLPRRRSPHRERPTATPQSDTGPTPRPCTAAIPMPGNQRMWWVLRSIHTPATAPWLRG